MPPSKGCFYLFAAGPGSEPEAGPEGLRLREPLARREQRGIISNGVNLSAEFNATTGLRVNESQNICMAINDEFVKSKFSPPPAGGD